MSLSDLAAIGTIVSSAAVIGSLIYLALQIRQAAANQRGTMHQMRAALSADVMLRIAEGPLCEPFRAGLTGAPDIGEPRFWQYFYAASAILRTTENAFTQFEDGLISEAHFATAKASAQSFLAYPGYRALWQATRASREPSFRAFMDALQPGASAHNAPDIYARWQTALAEQSRQGGGGAG
jgi:hypothetical protein